ncbi:MAG TPA: hypothetical protein VEU62_18715, partial [Bryobacterales bacterium]|nr:hypothetical protein [Bryobacterales bacterium]
PDLEGKNVLALDEFPLSLGSAYLILPHDALFGPGLFYGRSFSLPPGFVGDVSSAPAPAGIFLNTLTRLYGVSGFRYYPTAKFLVVRFTGWESGRFRYEKNPPPRLPYEIVSSAVKPQPGSFAVHRVAARREGSDTIVSVDLDAQLSPNTCLTATLSYFHHGAFDLWGRVEPERGLNLQPVLLRAPSPDDPQSARWVSTLRLHDFPRMPRLRLDFFAAGPDRSPEPLGRAEAAIEP